MSTHPSTASQYPRVHSKQSIVFAEPQSIALWIPVTYILRGFCRPEPNKQEMDEWWSVLQVTPTIPVFSGKSFGTTNNRSRELECWFSPLFFPSALSVDVYIDISCPNHDWKAVLNIAIWLRWSLGVWVDFLIPREPLKEWKILFFPLPLRVSIYFNGSGEVP
ncbi:hypothetical protein NPIL_307421 [Nephila pilipes]|uniref:Uncharacterized protein n=1 Tax=Nephila pilipes TaxID=299642 RepID=A0A8X6KQY1_NEPPI|nr:hypothetical protein NPIL_307421 [Nephila pilipes]